MTAIKTDKRTNDCLAVYDLDPQAAELWAVAGPDGIDPKTIDPNSLPDGFRWVGAEEWEQLRESSNLVIELTARAKAFTGEASREHKFHVDLTNGIVRVWDSVAGHYTTCHSLGDSANRRILGLARQLSRVK